jgi:hypothetical protein
MFGRIGELAKQALDDKVAFEPSEKEFTDLCKWLMGVITYVNGGRIQSCELVQEENVASSTRATADELYNVKLDRELLGQGQCQAIYIGRSKTQSSGKTAYISLILPLTGRPPDRGTIHQGGSIKRGLADKGTGWQGDYLPGRVPRMRTG